MNIQELATCRQYNTPVVICALNNRYLGMVRQWQEIEYSGRYASSYMDSLPDFVKLAEAYGHAGILIEDPSQVEASFEGSAPYCPRREQVPCSWTSAPTPPRTCSPWCRRAKALLKCCWGLTTV